jgi:hypothetical protein
VLKWLSDHHYGELVNLLSLVVSVVGFCWTIWAVIESKRAAQAAKLAAEKMRETLKLADTIMDVASAIRVMEEIKRLHRNRDWKVLLDRYATLRGLLIEIKSSRPNMSEDHRAALTGAILQIKGIENKVERALEKKEETLKISKFNEVVSVQIDSLSEILGLIRQEVGKEDNGFKADKVSTTAIGPLK